MLAHTDVSECAGGVGKNGICTRNRSILSAIIEVAGGLPKSKHSTKKSAASGDASSDASSNASSSDARSNASSSDASGNASGNASSNASGNASGDSLLPTADTPEAAVVREAAAVLGCSSESCVLVKLRQRRLVSEQDIRAEFARRFKPAGPRDSRALLSNSNIDGVLRRWADEFPDFCPCPFAMADFETNGDAFAQADPAQLRLDGEARGAPCRTFACVHNTDVSSGPGIHWVAVFVDMRPEPAGPGQWSVEYFNSAGRPPARPIVRWMERVRAQLVAARAQLSAGKELPAEAGKVETRAVTSVAHQKSQTECGPYALYYIRRRLEGAPIDEFADPLRRVSDAAMEEFRRHLFRAPL